MYFFFRNKLKIKSVTCKTFYAIPRIFIKVIIVKKNSKKIAWKNKTSNLKHDV